MFQEVETNLCAAVKHRVREVYAVQIDVTLEQPKQTSFGELAVPVAFQLARQLKKAPKAIAADIVNGLEKIEGVAAYEIAGDGYINVRLDRGQYARALLEKRDGSAPTTDRIGKIVVEHTNINPNKAAHIG
ncbi:MAG: arginine--tRNA ligase, partial [Acidobacteriaceae bacterium]|nr:arginine--tRNA ligase [Acidobacteriaceae bacterium]